MAGHGIQILVIMTAQQIKKWHHEANHLVDGKAVNHPHQNLLEEQGLLGQSLNIQVQMNPVMRAMMTLIKGE